MGHIHCRESNSADLWGQGVVVIRVGPGESNEAAWKRHLDKNPEDRQAMVKIFNHECEAGGGKDGMVPAWGPAKGTEMKLILRSRKTT